MPVPYMSAMYRGLGRPDEAACGTRDILSKPRSCRVKDTVSSVVVMMSPPAVTQHTTDL